MSALSPLPAREVVRATRQVSVDGLHSTPCLRLFWPADLTVGRAVSQSLVSTDEATS